MRSVSVRVRIGILSLLAFTLTVCSSSPEAQLEKHVNRGDRFSKEEKFREAVIEYKNAVKAVPKDPGPRWKLAKAAIETKDLSTAYTELQKVVELDPNNYEALGRLGELYLLLGKTEEVARIADILLNKQPEDPEGYILQAGLAIQAGKLEEAILKLKKAVELDPRQIRTLLSLGNLYAIQRDRRGALEWYDKALAADANSADVHMTRGTYFFSIGEREEGDKEFRKAIALSREKENLRILLAENYLYQERLEDCEKELNAVIKEYNSQKGRKVLAEIKLESGNLTETKAIVDAILKENENDLDGKYLKGRIALAEGRVDEAKTLFGDVVKQDAGMARAHLYNGLAEIRQGHIAVGRKEVEEAVRLEPRNARARLILGGLYLKSGASEEAGKAAIEVLRLNPANTAAAILLADSYLARKDWKRAEQIYMAIIRQSPRSTIGYMRMGESRKLQRKQGEAAGFFAQAMERDPKNISAINDYVFSLAALKDYSKADRVINEVVARDQGNPSIWEMVGRYKLVQGKSAEGEAAFLKAIALSPDYYKPYLELGLLYAAQGKFPQAEVNFRKIVEKNPKDIGTRALLGLVIQSQGKAEEATVQYRKVLEYSPKNILAANNLAAILTDGGGNLDEALKYAQIAREASPEDPTVADTLGWVYYRKGFMDTAYPLISEAASKSRKNPVIRYHYGMVLAGLGKKKEAEVEIKAALSLSPKFPGRDEASKAMESWK